ncbi:Zinc finger domain-containing protein, GATA-type [Akanthomyces lecanii RCEF 1005]|uniref:Zinc finger domain-containing protein, GATA-type n=1 Tax=Akanthomyces lecanii RCEF 1005 TaxID=1081108 RepID=A0A168CSD0_CORDF|nr:Zinc finger domain-containing protein, GATA-type [Akanthomyces lecanii RCEF 1005]
MRLATASVPAKNAVWYDNSYNTVPGHQRENYPNIGHGPSPSSRQVSPSLVAPPPVLDELSSISSNQSGTHSKDVAAAQNFKGSCMQFSARSIYRKNGFDIPRALRLVTSRKKPKTTLGPVDLSCAFVACDVTLEDCPVVYVSDSFQNLTGYSSYEVLGQNCRFLQSPDGKVEARAQRQYVDNSAVVRIKKGILERREVQQSLVNYRKGGKPFLNLLTLIPIPWDTDDIQYIIGFQIDLVQSPNAISNAQARAPAVDYRRNDIGWQPPALKFGDFDSRQEFGGDDVSAVLQQIYVTGSISGPYTLFWHEVLLGSLDSLVHILSPKGIFLYVSSSCSSILEYDAADLLGNSISSICHPSDIISINRELKNATAKNQVNMLFRIRRNRSGYMWFESHGSLFVEQGNGKKCVILLGRERRVCSISRRDIEYHGGIGGSDIWAKLSTSGAFLYVPSTARPVLRCHPDTLIATSFQDLLNEDSRPPFSLALESARRGNISPVKHKLFVQGRYIQVETMLYPGDAAKGQRSSFLVAQIKLVKPPSKVPVLVTSTVGSDTAEPVGLCSKWGGVGLTLNKRQDVHDSSDNIFDELSTTRCTSWQFELRRMERKNQALTEELAELLSRKKKRRRQKGVGNVVRDCANCHRQNTPEWRRGPSGKRDLCNRCGLQWAKQRVNVLQMGRISSRKAVGKTAAASLESPAASHKKEAENKSDSGSSNANDPTIVDVARSIAYFNVT